MYYSAEQQAITLMDRAQPVHHPRQKHIPFKKIIGVFVAISVVVAAGYGWFDRVQQSLSPQTEHAEVANNTITQESQPQVAGATFGDLLQQKRSYAGWVAGTHDGDIIISNPDSGEINSLTSVANQWHGPISQLYWSPDRTKIAYVALPQEEAEGFSQNPAAQASALGLNDVKSPQAFPYGKVVIVDAFSKELIQTGITIRNTPKSIAWMDDNRIAMIASTLVVYSLADKSAAPVNGVGVTNAEVQLQSPVVWNSQEEIMYFTEVRNLDHQSVRLISSISLHQSEKKELGMMRVGSFNDVAISQGIDLALSADASRLGVLSDEGLSYITLADGGVHRLPHNTEWLWMKESVLFDLIWLTPSKLAFGSMAVDGSKVWGAWDIPAAKLQTFGKGSLAAVWDKASGRLAFIQSDRLNMGILTPNWDKPENSVVDVIDLPWESVSW
jgi:hypothetical protein